MKPQTFADLKPKIVLGIAAHPDDLDFGAGGTLAAFAKQGAEVHYLQLTDGGKGSSDPNMTSAEIIKIRQNEQQAACQAIGGTSVHFLNHPDGELEVTMALKEEIVKVIRTIKPDVVITTDPTMVYDAEYGIINHSDHRAAGQAALDAVYPLARDHLALPKLYAEGYQPHKVKTVLMTNFTGHNFFVDITDSLETKFAAVKAHASQIQDYDRLKQLFTGMAEKHGQAAGCQYAEGFVRLDVML
ncbi:MAG: LmbE family protein [Candidatus Saccharibacteria bacterium]|nr:LmbE family protein [Candidatus Saccharibacteria bacterium]